MILAFTIVPRKYDPPPFCNLSLSTKSKGDGGLYTWDARFSLVITPSLLVCHIIE